MTNWPMRYNELIKILSRKGCVFESNGGNHDWWYSPITDRRFQIPRHRSKEVAPGTLKSILKQAGVEL